MKRATLTHPPNRIIYPICQHTPESEIDLAIVDVFLQGTSGLDVISIMRERVPDLPVVAISGMMTLDFVSTSPGLCNVVCLQKPFRPNQLVHAIKTAQKLSRPSAAGDFNGPEVVIP
jgi:DNA-binding NtrC family response regulator